MEAGVLERTAYRIREQRVAGGDRGDALDHDDSTGIDDELDQDLTGHSLAEE